MAYLTQEQKKEVRLQDRTKVKDLHDKIETIQAIKGDKLQKRYQQTKEQIIKLTEEREELFSQPICKAELLELAKQEYQKNKEEFAMQGLLKKHLAECQGHRSYPFNPTNIRVNMLTESQVWRLFFLVFTEKDIEETIATLPDIGISVEERERRIREIDKQIDKLSSQVEKDLKEV